MYGEEDEIGFSPDGLTADMIDALIVDVADELADESEELSAAMLALVDSKTQQRRTRRKTHQVLTGTVRELRAHLPMSVAAGTEAA